jgi:cytosine/adenosine deaminase-related metal-dependent hydrolase
MIRWARPVSFVNARVVLPDGMATQLRFSSRILAIDAAPRAGDVVVDLDGAFVLPGLINAHDHLELNHYGLLKRRDRYESASAWIDDLRPVLAANPGIHKQMAYPLAARLFVGGLKNILCGVTTVAHHNPRYREIGRWFPVRVVKKYGWAHSFRLEGKPVGARGEPGAVVRDACLATPADEPFIVHAGEGVDAAAAAELPRLEALGCVRANTVLVHGVAFSPADWTRVLARGASLVWCPASNIFLFGTTAPIRAFLDASPAASAHLCLGSDSRLTGAIDLLGELRAGRDATAVTPCELLRAVTTAPAGMLKLADAGRIAVGGAADLMVLPALGGSAADALLAATRRDIALVTIGGRPMVGSPALRTVFEARRAAARPIVVDGTERLAESRLGWAIAQCPIAEPGVECRS